MPQIFGFPANENARYKRNELELIFIYIPFSYYKLVQSYVRLQPEYYFCISQFLTKNIDISGTIHLDHTQIVKILALFI